MIAPQCPVSPIWNLMHAILSNVPRLQVTWNKTYVKKENLFDDWNYMEFIFYKHCAKNLIWGTSKILAHWPKFIFRSYDQSVVSTFHFSFKWRSYDFPFKRNSYRKSELQSKFTSFIMPINRFHFPNRKYFSSCTQYIKWNPNIACMIAQESYVPNINLEKCFRSGRIKRGT